MSVSEESHERNQIIIIEKLAKNKNSLTLLELKKKSQLANLYFFQALIQLEHNNILERIKKDDITWIFLKNTLE